MIRQMLVPLDGSVLAEAVLPHAMRLAKAFGAEVLVLRVVGTRLSGVGHYIDTFDWRLKRAEAERYVERIAEMFREGRVEARSEVAVGRASEQILATARRARAELIVLTTHGEGGLSEFRVSGTAAKVMGPAEASVLLVPAVEAGSASSELYQTIVVPTDCSPRAEWALFLAGAVARVAGAKLVLLYVVTTPEAVSGAGEVGRTVALARELREANRESARLHLERLVVQLAQSNVPAQVRVVEDEDVARAIRQVAEEEGASLVAMAAHGARATAEVPHGMVAANLLGSSRRPLLLLQDAPIRRFDLPPTVARRAWRSAPGVA